MDAALFPARVLDTYNSCERSGVPRYLGFLTSVEAANASEQLSRFNARFVFSGGYDNAERTMLACIPDWCDEPQFPIRAVTFSFRDCDSLSHRDFLGALMSLGIVREAVGDIMVETGRAVVFLTDEICGYVMSQITKVGNVGVEIREGCDFPLPEAGTKVLHSDTVASLRLDCVVSALAGVSRSAAAQLIGQDMVSVNSLCCSKTTKTVALGDRITIRGKGRFEIGSVSGLSKKGRIILEYYKYE